jgi:hypothetical protein
MLRPSHSMQRSRLSGRHPEVLGIFRSSYSGLPNSMLNSPQIFSLIHNQAQKLNNILIARTEKVYVLYWLAKWHEKVRQSGFKSFNSVARSIENHNKMIVNYFDIRSINASAKSFNGATDRAKIKACSAQF